MHPHIKNKVKEILWKTTKHSDIDYFEEIGFTDEDLERINAIPAGVSDINFPDFCSQTFLDSFKSVIDTQPRDSINLILDKVIIRLEEEYGTFPINPNKHEFSSISETKIIKERVTKIIEEKYL